MKKKFFLCVLLPLVLAGFALDTSAAGKSEINMRLQNAYYSFDSSEYRSIVKMIDGELRKAPNDFALHYYAAIAKMNLCRILYGSNKHGANKAITAASENVDYMKKKLDSPTAKRKLNIGNNEAAEIYALHSAVYGLRTGLNLLKKIQYGKIAQETVEKAYKLAPENPKVLLIAAKHLMCIPDFFGGDKERSEEMLKKALRNYSPSPPAFKKADGSNADYSFIDWASTAEIYAYLAQLELFRGNEASARRYMNKALRYRADYGFVLYDLELQFEK